MIPFTTFDALLLLFLTLMLIFTILVFAVKDLLLAVIFSGVEGLFLAFIYFILQAPDISLAQIAVDVGIETLVFIAVVFWTRRYEE
jgi:uncharacterized MnhB-related membrane protein